MQILKDVLATRKVAGRKKVFSINTQEKASDGNIFIVLYCLRNNPLEERHDMADKYRPNFTRLY